MKGFRYQRAGGVEGQTLGSRPIGFVTGQINLQTNRRVARHLERYKAIQPLDQKTGRFHRQGPAGLPSSLGAKITRRWPSPERRHRLPVKPHHHHFGESFIECQFSLERLDNVMGPVTIQNQPMGFLSREGGSHLQPFPETSEAEEADTILTLSHQLEPLLWGERPFTTMSNMGGDVPKSLRPVHLGDDALAVVEYLEARHPFLSNPSHANELCLRVQTILNQLRQGLSWVGLAERQPADQLERVMDPHATFLHATRRPGPLLSGSVRLVGGGASHGVQSITIRALFPPLAHPVCQAPGFLGTPYPTGAP